MSRTIANLNVSQFEPLPSPEQISSRWPLNERAKETVVIGRDEIRHALRGENKRPIIIVGPCSIHDPKAALAYAKKLAALRTKLSDRMILVMRVYFEKPRTTVGWKGLINDPYLDNSYNISEGLSQARELLLNINALGLPCATEFLDPIVPQYTSDLVSWAAIGARTTESQTHRQMASGLSMPVGFKNATDGSLDVAINAMISAQHQHAFVGLDMQGKAALVRTTGNQDLHLVLRGGGGRTNYSRADVMFTKVRMEETFPSLEKHRMIMIDCSHGNSLKDYRRQPEVFQAVLAQILKGEKTILGMMLESNLIAGNQKLKAGELNYGQSITDSCIDWGTTESLLQEAFDALV